MFIFFCQKLLAAHVVQLLFRQGVISHKTASPELLGSSALGLFRRPCGCFSDLHFFYHHKKDNET